MDFARGVAALIVVLQHWPQHFGRLPGYEFTVEELPAFAWLKPFYLSGASAVAFFFCLSGFIFHWLYAERISLGVVKFGEFATLRLSRLYPLHLATLVACLALQAVIYPALNQSFVYAYHDPYHIALNLLLVHGWGFAAGYSLNGPSWSISVEVALYLLFFLACRCWRPGFIKCIVAGLMVWGLAHVSIVFSSAVGFFAGGATYYVYRRLAARRSGWIVVASLGATIAFWTIASLTGGRETIVAEHQWMVSEFGASGVGRGFAFAAKLILQRQFELMVFPCSVLTIALAESAFAVDWTNRWRGFGDISYGVYLLHFPLQLLFAAAALCGRPGSGFFISPLVMMIFFVLMILLAVVSYRWLKKPAMVAVRTRWRARQERVLSATNRSTEAEPENLGTGRCNGHAAVPVGAPHWPVATTLYLIGQLADG